MCRQCIYCDKPIEGENGISYGGEIMHAACYVRFNDEMGETYPDVPPPVDFDLLPEMLDAAFPELSYDVDPDLVIAALRDLAVEEEDKEAFFHFLASNES